MACFAPGKLHTTQMFCSRISFRRNRSESTGEILTFYNGSFALDFFLHGEREVVETVSLVIFPLISFKKRPGVQPERKGVKAVVLGPESSDTEIKDAFEGKCKSVCLYKVGALSSG